MRTNICSLVLCEEIKLYLKCAIFMLLGLLQSEVFKHRMIQYLPVTAGQVENSVSEGLPLFFYAASLKIMLVCFQTTACAGTSSGKYWSTIEENIHSLYILYIGPLWNLWQGRERLSILGIKLQESFFRALLRIASPTTTALRIF